MNITIKGLEEGEWKELTEKEQSGLLRAVGRPVN
jgi:16S rRNA U516 pseudouridylate synthase RsuA-like enzyme